MLKQIGFRPEEVDSPKDRWKTESILDDGSLDTDGSVAGCALAVGRWCGKPVLALRWNGDETKPIGNPQSRGIPTWFIVPEKLNEAILKSDYLPADKLAIARSFIPDPGEKDLAIREIDSNPMQYMNFFRWQRQHLEILKSLTEAGGQKHYAPNQDIILHGRLYELQNMLMIERVTDAPTDTFRITDFGFRVQTANWETT